VKYSSCSLSSDSLNLFLLQSNNTYGNVIGDYTVGSLVKNIRWIYFTLLQLIISWINVCCFTNQSWLSGYKFSLLRHTVFLVGNYSLLLCPQSLWVRSIPQHSAGLSQELTFIVLVIIFQSFPSHETLPPAAHPLDTQPESTRIFDGHMDCLS
jgi:hypothetical protein